MESLVFQEHPAVTLATNVFISVPVILQYESVPLISIVKTKTAGFTTEIPIYHNDGTYLAKVVGSQVHSTPAGIKAGITTRQPQGMTVCELNGKPIFEVRRDNAAALKLAAELYAPGGLFVNCSDRSLTGFITVPDAPLRIGNSVFAENTFKGFPIGILIEADGCVSLGATRPRQKVSVSLNQAVISTLQALRPELSK